jgi:hypothetical protein
MEKNQSNGRHYFTADGKTVEAPINSKRVQYLIKVDGKEFFCSEQKIIKRGKDYLFNPGLYKRKQEIQSLQEIVIRNYKEPDMGLLYEAIIEETLDKAKLTQKQITDRVVALGAMARNYKVLLKINII